jgi:amino-acid N-acetyltransferase
MEIRLRNASPEDINDIYKIIKYYSGRGLILKRSRKDIADALDRFWVAETNNKPAGIISFYDYGATLKEIRSLAVSKNAIRSGIGSTLLKMLIDILVRQYPNATIFVLTYSPDFFAKYGFKAVNKESLPEKIWKDCLFCKDRLTCRETALVYRKPDIP